MGGQIGRLSVNSECVDIQAAHKRLTLDIKNQDKLLQTYDFCVAWDKASKIERAYALTTIDDVNAKAIRRWMNSILYDPLQGLTIAELHQIASNNHILNYKKINREELIAKMSKKGISC